MPQFFIKEHALAGAAAFIRGEDCHHLINVRRIMEGDVIKIRDISGKGYNALVADIKSHEIRLHVLEETHTVHEYIEISLYMCLIKGGNFDSAIQKAVEAGVDHIIPVISERTVPDPGKKANEKQQRWNRIALGAAKQCMRSSIPQVGLPLGFPEALNDTYSEMKIIAHPEADTKLHGYLSSVKKPDAVSILVGPEGGFTPGEIALACEKLWVPVNCGSNHLRAETAAVILPSLVIYHWS